MNRYYIETDASYDRMSELASRLAIETGHRV